MEMDDPVWLEATAGVQAEVDAELRADAYEVYLAEAARSRLAERRGPARLTLRSGQVLVGELVPSVGDGLEGTLTLRESDGRVMQVACSAVALVTGAPSQLRDEQPAARPRTVGSRLREAWTLAEPVRVLLCSGRWIDGVVDFVGADHLVLGGEDEPVIVALGAVDVWVFGR